VRVHFQVPRMRATTSRRTGRRLDRTLTTKGGHYLLCVMCVRNGSSGSLWTYVGLISEAE
jgi:hypothetical protein